MLDGPVCGRRFRILALVNDYSRDCLHLIADTSNSGMSVARELESAMLEWFAKRAMVASDNGTNLTSMGDPAIVTLNGITSRKTSFRISAVPAPLEPRGQNPGRNGSWFSRQTELGG